MSIDKERFMSQALDPEKEQSWQLARRDDLASVLGIALTVPFHGEDASGRWRYGLRPAGGFANQDIVSSFEREMRAIVVESVSPLVESGVLTKEQAESIRSHDYETGPAAQGWPQIFIEVYQQVQPFISGSADLISIADAIRQLALGLKNWQEHKRAEIERDQGEAFDRTVTVDLDPNLVLTLPCLVALCYDDLVNRHGLVGDISVTVFPRNVWAGYGSADHPAGSETYLIRLTIGGSQFFYLVDGRGRVSEHYRTGGDDLELLAIPDLLPNEMSGNAYRQPEQPREFEVRVTDLPNKRS